MSLICNNNDPVKHRSPELQTKLPSNFVYCGAKFLHATQTLCHFSIADIWKYLALYGNKPLE